MAVSFRSDPSQQGSLLIYLSLFSLQLTHLALLLAFDIGVHMDNLELAGNFTLEILSLISHMVVDSNLKVIFECCRMHILAISCHSQSQ